MSRRVVLVSDAAEFAGAELYVATLANALRSRFAFDALVPDDAPAEMRDRLADAGASVRPVRALERRPHPRAFVALAGEIRSLSPDLVHVNLTDQGDGLGPLLAARAARRPVVATLHVVVPGRAEWREIVSSRALRLADRVIAVSEATAAYCRRRSVRAVVVRNGLEAPAPAPDGRATLGVSEADFVVGGIGRLSRQKGWDVLCKAAPLVRARVPNVRFLVVGAGNEHDALAVGRDVEFLGYRERASSYLPAFDLLVLPSRYEGLPLVAIEALSSGVPMVATDIEGIREAAGECAAFVPVENHVRLADAIVELAGDAGRRHDLAACGRARARELFGARRMADETAAVYDALIGTRGGTAAARTTR